MAAGYSDSVFINCPFDDAYIPLLQATVYAVYRCGFIPQSALGADNAVENRLDKIIRCIKNCRYGIHDLSRIEMNVAGFPRFNMPFELGIFFGAKKLGKAQQHNKSALVFERVKYTYQQYISDLNGIDTKAHGNDPLNVIRQIRNWLSTESRRTTIPGQARLIAEFQDFISSYPAVATAAGLDPVNLPFNDFCLILEEDVRVRIKKTY